MKLLSIAEHVRQMQQSLAANLGFTEPDQMLVETDEPAAEPAPSKHSTKVGIFMTDKTRHPVTRIWNLPENNSPERLKQTATAFAMVTDASERANKSRFPPPVPVNQWTPLSHNPTAQTYEILEKKIRYKPFGKHGEINDHDGRVIQYTQQPYLEQPRPLDPSDFACELWMYGDDGQPICLWRRPGPTEHDVFQVRYYSPIFVSTTNKGVMMSMTVHIEPLIASGWGFFVENRCYEPYNSKGENWWYQNKGFIPLSDIEPGERRAYRLHLPVCMDLVVEMLKDQRVPEPHI